MKERFIYNNNLVNNSEYVMEVSGYTVRPSKHFITTWMRKWNFNTDSLRELIENAYKNEKVGKNKYETSTKSKGKSRKLIFIKDDEYKEIFIITGAEGT